MTDRCPDPESLERFQMEALPPEESSIVERHVSSCETCRTRVGELAEHSGLLSDMKEAFGGNLPPGLAPEAPPPEAIGRFEVLGEVGRGGMGSILRVRDPDLRREMAVKLVHADEVSTWAAGGASEFGSGSAQVSQKAHGRFLEEAQVTSQLAHPGIVPVHGLGELPDGRPYFTMQLVHGRNLREIFELVEKGEEGWTRTRALGVCLRVCEAMAYAHSKGVIHRDLKPSNVMVGEFGEVYVMDWGVARVLGRRDAHDRKLRQAIDSARQTKRSTPEDGDSNLYTMDGDVVGTPVYMAPEQAEGSLEQVGERSDVYSVGALLYHLLSGQVPYVEPGERPSGHEVLRRVIAGPPKSIALVAKDAPAELAAICDKAMGRKPGDRYGSMQDLGDDLRAYLEHRVVHAYETGALAEFKKWVRRNRKLSAALALALLAVLGGLAAVTIQQVTSRKALELEGDIYLLSFLRERADELWPAHPSKIPEMEDWLAGAEAMLSREPRHRAKLVRLQSSDSVTTPHQQRFLSELEVFQADEGLLGDVRERLDFASTIEARSITDDAPARAWREAAARLRKDERFSGVILAPQLGLLPIGPDPRSGFEEFADLATGTLPQREPDGTLRSAAGASLVFVLLPGGTFRMGNPDEGEPGRYEGAPGDESPAHEVSLAPFFLSKFEMTQGQYLRGIGHNPSRFSPGTREGEYVRTETHPVERLSWIDAAEAMRRLGWQLPTEAQWEYAVRGGTRTVWFTGDDLESLPGYVNVADATTQGKNWNIVWPELDDGWLYHAPVDAFEPNPWGFHGMLGNCWEWCRDWVGMYDLPVKPGDSERLVEAERQKERIYRGSSFKHSLLKTRSSDRGGDPPWFRDEYMGVRPARALEGNAAIRTARLETDSVPPYAVLSSGRLELCEAEVQAPILLGEGDISSFCFDRGPRLQGSERALIVTRGGELHRVDSAGESRMLLSEESEVRFPDVSSRNGDIVYAKSMGDKVTWRLSLFDRASGLTRDLGPGYDPCFSSDAASIVFEDYDEEGPDLYLLELATLHRERLLPEGASRRYTPCFSPTGEVIFSSDGRLMSASLTGPPVVRALSPEGVYDRFASFAPDGQTMLFFRQDDGGSAIVLRNPSGHERSLREGPVWMAAFAP